VLFARYSKAVGGDPRKRRGKGGKRKMKRKRKRKRNEGTKPEGKKETQKDIAASDMMNINTFKCQ
jgi:hypothetical protein